MHVRHTSGASSSKALLSVFQVLTKYGANVQQMHNVVL